MGKILKANSLCKRLQEKIKENIPSDRRLTLASLKIGNDYSSKIYTLQQAKVTQQLNIDYRPLSFDTNTSLNRVLQKIEELNKDDSVVGIVVNKPFPQDWAEERIFSAIDADKDIEGVHPRNLGKLFLGSPVFVSPTVLSILEFIKYAEVKLYGRKVTIISSSNIIGKPLALLLADRFATVTITHIATYEKQDLEFYVTNADLLISAAGVPGLVKGNWIKKDAVVVDVGTGEKDGKITGDVEFEIAKERASVITPVPGGVGKLTTLFLFHNLVIAAKRQKSLE